ncbi:oligopeptide transporter, OPT family [Budviciaceae bacterium BWR-B9]|uniref:Oligopeptide transporter, OPT family n=1 Tax=Limnobaculum allomyrinae TaxID=2791986 RepID=A0ABS1IQ27_9GAMM|nr:MULTISPECIES: oligopeptide transporter, OPT family [Limnobaculum]MBK5143749.1 oligopeptide transporter, OPT family [Limnobaculum allomyrinae]MBV7693488.1 oligopeptide transporter, OPT family [Limnobaculum sp. M2-1]
MENTSQIRELTLRGIIIGALITVVFTASNVYLGLKVGLTFSSAIPAAVISMAVLRFFSKSNILENNMVQTQASAAGTLSSVIFILPGLLMIGYWNSFPFWQTLLICSAGGMLGVVFSIPLRHAMVVKSNLPYPEGVAAAEILKAGCNDYVDENDKLVSTNEGVGDDKDNGFRDILFGGFIAAAVSFATNGLRILADGASYWFTQGRAIFQIPLGFSLALLSAGYLIGIAAGIAILVGSIIAWGVAIPIISSLTGSAEGLATLSSWGVSVPMDIVDSGSISALAMTLWKTNVRFIGAGTLAIAAIWTLLTLVKPIIEGMKTSLRALNKNNTGEVIPRTELDLSPKIVLLISVVMFLVLIGTFYSFVADSGLSATTAWGLVFASVIFAFLIGFLVAAACGYMAGLVGSSASPISGIGIIAITAISLLLLFLGGLNGMLETEQGTNFATALAIFTTSAVLAIATISNDNLQDLKTGYLVKATPWRQQVALLIGCIVGAAVISPVLELLYNAYGFTGATPRPDMDPNQVLAAPQATLMTTIAKGIFSHKLEWTMIITGLVVGAVVIMIDVMLAKKGSKLRIPALAVGMGIYLPPAITAPLIIGSVLSWLVASQVKKRAQAQNGDFKEMYKPVERKGALIASGLIVGESLVGVALAVLIVISISNGGSDAPLSISSWLEPVFGSSGVVEQLLGLAVFVIVCILFVRRVLSALKAK